MSKKNRKNNRNNNVVTVDPYKAAFEQYLMAEYGDVVNEAYNRFQTALQTQQMFDELDTIRVEIEQRDAKAEQKRREQEAAAVKAAKRLAAKTAAIKAQEAKIEARKTFLYKFAYAFVWMAIPVALVIVATFVGS